mmetsp:Transcript_30235/g.64061  ORF Transcript_30235/g.64061 Transcript_30235/m.64061 type:complete len:1027 (+) Transcript_30235:142-3222(+)
MQWINICFIATAITATTLTVADAFSTGTGPGGVITSSTSAITNHDNNNGYCSHYQYQRCPSGRFSMQIMSAAANSDDDSDSDGSGSGNNGNNKSIFDQAFKFQMPWEEDDAAPSSKSSPQEQQQQQWQWWPNNSNSEASSQPQAKPVRKQQRQRKPQRVPRYPSALQEQPDESSASSPAAVVISKSNRDDVDKYVQSAEDAVKSIINQPNSDSKEGSDVKAKKNKPRQSKQPKLGILLIDHGSKRKASNDHLHSIAQSYQSTWEDDGISTSTTNNNTTVNDNNERVSITVRAAHMEIASPSILAQLRQLLSQDDSVTTVICVPYFLSPGKHATMDVPKLINEARDILNEEGLLDYYDSENDDGRSGKKEKKKRVEIISTKALGSNVDSMLGVVDDLVRMTLDKGDYHVFQLNGHNNDSGNNDTANNRSISNMHNDEMNGNNMRNDEMNHMKEDELRKYTNRATLLENMLQTKVQQLTTMTNRVTLMEDALTKMQGKLKREEEENRRKSKEELQGERQRLIIAEQQVVANLTNTIEIIGREKKALESDIELMALQRVDMEKEYNSTIVDLEAKIASLEQELQRLNNDENERQKEEQATGREEAKEDEEELQQEIQRQQQQQQEKIQELQTQLADLLDAHSELELLQNDTEATVLKYKQELQNSRDGYESSLKVEQDEKENYRVKWMDIQRQLEEDGTRLQQMLDESTSKYEVWLEEEMAKADEWRVKWKALNDAEQSSIGNGTLLSTISNSSDDLGVVSAAAAAVEATRTEEEWINLQNELKGITTAKDDAMNKIQELELQLHQLNQQVESSSNAQKEEQQQQQQLQKYLQSQLSTYYDTIQDQTLQIGEYEQKLNDMAHNHEESMLIATNSVKASQLREENLLTNIEELESELAIVKKEKDGREKELNDLQDDLNKMEEDRDGSLDERDDDSASLMIQIEQLQCKVQEVTQEKDRIWLEKTKIEMEKMIDNSGAKGSVSDKATTPAEEGVLSEVVEKPKQGRRRRWIRGILRPWTLLRRRTVDTDP